MIYFIRYQILKLDILLEFCLFLLHWGASLFVLTFSYVRVCVSPSKLLLLIFLIFSFSLLVIYLLLLSFLVIHRTLYIFRSAIKRYGSTGWESALATHHSPEPTVGHPTKP